MGNFRLLKEPNKSFSATVNKKQFVKAVLKQQSPLKLIANNKRERWQNTSFLKLQPNLPNLVESDCSCCHQPVFGSTERYRIPSATAQQHSQAAPSQEVKHTDLPISTTADNSEIEQLQRQNFPENTTCRRWCSHRAFTRRQDQLPLVLQGMQSPASINRLKKHNRSNQDVWKTCRSSS